MNTDRIIYTAFLALYGFALLLFAFQALRPGKALQTVEQWPEPTMETIEVRPPLACTDDVRLQRAAQRNPNIVCQGVGR